MIFRKLRIVLFMLAVGLLGATAWAELNLPIKSINGKRCYVYVTKRGDTVYGVAAMLGITRNDIIQNNPSASDGLSPHMALYFPVDEFQMRGADDDKLQAETTAYGSDQDTDGTTVRYVVKKGDTLFGIAHEFNVSADDIAQKNPSAANGVRAGQILLIPVPGADDSMTVGSGPDALRKVNRGRNVISIAENTMLEDENTQGDVEMPEDAADTISTATEGISAEYMPKESTIVVLLPFMLNDEKPGKTAGMITDFYKGMLIAADTMMLNLPKVNIVAIDTEGSTDRVEQLLENEPRLRTADIIVAPDNPSQLSYLSNFSRRNKVFVFNSMNPHDTSYVFSPYMIQASIQSDRMLEKAVEACINDNLDFTPVLMLNESSRNDKKNFVDMLVEAYKQKGILPQTVAFNSSLTLSDLIEQLGEPDMNTRLIFIPSSGAMTEFSRFSSAIEKYRNKAVEAGGDVRVFGFPEWTTFRGDTRKALHDINATVYTRSYSDPNSLSTTGVNNSFVKWYGHEMTDGVPAQGLLGYDAGCFILKSLADGTLSHGDFENTDWRGSQSAFRLRLAGEGQGPVNDALYIVHFLPGEVTDVEIQ